MKNDEISYHSSFFNFFFFAASLGKRCGMCGTVTVKRDDIIIIININKLRREEDERRKDGKHEKGSK